MLLFVYSLPSLSLSFLSLGHFSLFIVKICPLNMCFRLSSHVGDDEGREKTFLDKCVCRPFILGICISELFVNTVSEMRVELDYVQI